MDLDQQSVNTQLSGWRSVKALASNRCDPGSIQQPHVRWSCGHQVRQVGFFRALRIPPIRRPSERKTRCQRA